MMKLFNKFKISYLILFIFFFLFFIFISYSNFSKEDSQSYITSKESYPTFLLSNDVSSTLPIISFNAPAHWSKGELSQFRLGSYYVNDQEKRIDISVSKLSTNGFDLLSNVNRWRSQLDLPFIKKSDLYKYVTRIKFNNRDFFWVNKIQNSNQGMIVAMLKYQDMVWFFKLNGENSLVDQEKDSFVAFINTVEFNE